MTLAATTQVEWGLSWDMLPIAGMVVVSGVAVYWGQRHLRNDPPHWRDEDSWTQRSWAWLRRRRRGSDQS